MLLQIFLPPPALEGRVDSFLVQEELAPSNFANRHPVQVLPTAMTVIGIQYGQPMHRVENGIARAMGTSGLTGLQTTVREYISTGAIGTIIIRFKPGGLSRLTSYPIHEFQDANVPLDLVFPQRAVQEMEERLAGAASVSERIAIVQDFLISVMKERDEDRVVLQAAR